MLPPIAVDKLIYQFAPLFRGEASRVYEVSVKKEIEGLQRIRGRIITDNPHHRDKRQIEQMRVQLADKKPLIDTSMIELAEISAHTFALSFKQSFYFWVVVRFRNNAGEMSLDHSSRKENERKIISITLSSGFVAARILSLNSL